MHTQLFDCFTAKVLGELYEQFPIKKRFITSEFNKDVCVQFYRDEQGAKIDEILYGTIVFLEENELITFDRSKNGWQSGVFSDTGLTLKGLQLLKKEPQTMRADYESVGDKIINAMKDKGIQSAASVVNEKLWGLMS